MAISRDSRTYRVRQLPYHMDRHQVVRLLCTLLDSIEPGDIQIYSLASSLSPWERPPTKVATVMFGRLPAILDSDETEWVLHSQRAGLQRNIIIDIHFLGFTALNDVQLDKLAFEFVISAIRMILKYPNVRLAALLYLALQAIHSALGNSQA